MDTTKCKQLTLVTHYGEKPVVLAHLIRTLQSNLSDNLGSAFKPYKLGQVHGTIVGLEGEIKESGLVNKWYLENLQQERPIDFKKLLDYLHSDDLNDINVKIGGWILEHDYQFSSNGQHPYTRSFSIRGEIAVAMGWPVNKERYTDSLYQLRKRFEKFNVLHKWNVNNYQDNDFFFVLGRVARTKQLEPKIKNAEDSIREFLSETAQNIVINRDTMSFVAYTDTQLPLDSSIAYRLADPTLTPALLKQLYY